MNNYVFITEKEFSLLKEEIMLLSKISKEQRTNKEKKAADLLSERMLLKKGHKNKLSYEKINKSLTNIINVNKGESNNELSYLKSNLKILNARYSYSNKFPITKKLETIVDSVLEINSLRKKLENKNFEDIVKHYNNYNSKRLTPEQIYNNYYKKLDDNLNNINKLTNNSVKNESVLLSNFRKKYSEYSKNIKDTTTKNDLEYSPVDDVVVSSVKEISGEPLPSGGDIYSGFATTDDFNSKPRVVNNSDIEVKTPVYKDEDENSNYSYTLSFQVMNRDFSAESSKMNFPEVIEEVEFSQTEEPIKTTKYVLADTEDEPNKPQLKESTKLEFSLEKNFIAVYKKEIIKLLLDLRKEKKLNDVSDEELRLLSDEPDVVLDDNLIDGLIYKLYSMVRKLEEDETTNIVVDESLNNCLLEYVKYTNKKALFSNVDENGKFNFNKLINREVGKDRTEPETIYLKYKKDLETSAKLLSESLNYDLTKENKELLRTLKKSYNSFRSSKTIKKVRKSSIEFLKGGLVFAAGSIVGGTLNYLSKGEAQSCLSLVSYGLMGSGVIIKLATVGLDKFVDENHAVKLRSSLNTLRNNKKLANYITLFGAGLKVGLCISDSLVENSNVSQSLGKDEQPNDSETNINPDVNNDTLDNPSTEVTDQAEYSIKIGDSLGETKVLKGSTTAVDAANGKTVFLDQDIMSDENTYYNDVVIVGDNNEEIARLYTDEIDITSLAEEYGVSENQVVVNLVYQDEDETTARAWVNLEDLLESMENSSKVK